MTPSAIQPEALVVNRKRSLGRAGAADSLYLSATTEPYGHSTCFNDDRYLTPAIRIPEHPLKAIAILKHIYIVEGDFTAGKILTGSRGIGSKILTEN